MDIREEDLISARERETAERHKRIAEAFKELRERFPQYSQSRVAQAIAEKESMTVPGVFYALRKQGLLGGREA